LAASAYHQLTFAVDDDPLDLVSRLVGARFSDGHVVYEQPGAWYFASGVLGEVVVTATAATVRWQGERERRLTCAQPLRALEAAVLTFPTDDWRAYGWLTFEAASPPAGPSAAVDTPLAHLVVPELDVNIGDGRVTVRSTDRARMLRAWEVLGSATTPERGHHAPVDPTAHGRLEYEAAVLAAIDELWRGELQKVVLSRPLPLDFPVDFLSTYVRGRRANTPARSFLVRLGGWEAAGFSPEVVLAVAADGRVSTQPLAGTRALRGADAAAAALRHELLTDPKEIFEHALSVRVATEELQRVCVPDSIAVHGFMTVKERGTVQHLGSRVDGLLRPGRTAWQALEAVFPAVTATGSPRPAAHRAIAQLERRPRGLYGGAVLVVDSAGGLDAALVLRAVLDDGRGGAWLQAGAGIVAGSKPAREFEETCEKLASVAQHLVRQEGGDSAHTTGRPDVLGATR